MHNRSVPRSTTNISNISKHNLPKPPSLWQTLGPSFILLGLALGSGELILWPYLSANYGLGLLWGGLLGITFQFVLNTEVMRYSLAWGESVFVGFRQMGWVITLWYIISTLIPWSIPGFSSAASQIIFHMFGGSLPIDTQIGEKIVAISLLIITGLILSLGKTLYKTMEVLQRSVIFLGLPFILFLTFWLAQSTDWQEVVWGLVGRGDGWQWFPQGIALASFLGAFAYSGAGGNLNLAQSYYIKEKGFGMGKFSSKIISVLSGGSKAVNIEGKTFKDTPHNRRLWDKWWKLINTEHFIVFWGLGFITIVVLALLAKILVYGSGVDSGISFLYAEAAQITIRTHAFFGTFFLIVAAMMLFSTQLGVLESSSRIISENTLLLFYKKGRKYNMSLGFYVALWAQIALGIIIYSLGWVEPRLLLTVSAILNGIAMMVSFPLIYLLNKKKLAKRYQPALWRKAIMLMAFVFFVIFVVITLSQGGGH